MHGAPFLGDEGGGEAFAAHDHSLAPYRARWRMPFESTPSAEPRERRAYE
jgi:hypothetical protein